MVISPTMWLKTRAPVLGDFEQLVLLGVLRLELQDSAYGAAIRQEIHACSGRDVSINAVYTTLDRLQSKGFFKSWVGDPPPAAGGPPSEVLCAAPHGCRGFAPGVPCLYRHGGRPPEPAGGEVKKTTDPPRLSISLLTRRLSAEWRDFIVGDLEEEFATRSSDSPVAAPAGLWWQTIRCLGAPPPVRPNPSPPGSSQGDSRMRPLFAD